MNRLPSLELSSVVAAPAPLESPWQWNFGVWLGLVGLLLASVLVILRERARSDRLQREIHALKEAVNVLDVGFAMFDTEERLVLCNQVYIVQMLKRFAECVDVAVDGREAVSMFKSARYDCVLMDGQMPEVDGLEATRQIREYEVEHGRRRTPIIALTANAMLNDRETFLAGGMDEYLSKPVRVDALAAAFVTVASMDA